MTMFDNREVDAVSEDVKGPTGTTTIGVAVIVPWASNGKAGKYRIRAIRIPSRNGNWTWLACAPYRTWRMFGSWEEAALYLWLYERDERSARYYGESEM